MFSGIAGVENFSAGGCGEKSKSDIYDACKGLVTSEDGKESDYFWALFSQTLLDSCFLVVVNPHNSPELRTIIPILQKLRPSDINRIDQKLVNKGDEIKKYLCLLHPVISSDLGAMSWVLNPGLLFLAMGSRQPMTSLYKKFYQQKVVWFRQNRNIILILWY